MDWRKIILFLLLTLPIPAAAQRIAVKSNVLYLAAGTPDVGAELVIGEQPLLEGQEPGRRGSHPLYRPSAGAALLVQRTAPHPLLRRSEHDCFGL